MIAGNAPAWATWLALGLWAAAFFAFGVVFVQARRLWRQLRPTLAPMLLAFGIGVDDTAQASAGTDNGQAAATGSSPADALAGIDPLDVQRPPHKQ